MRYNIFQPDVSSWIESFRMSFSVRIPIILAFTSLSLWAASDSSAEDFFENRVRPLLAGNCYACHTESMLGGLRVDSRESLLKGGKLGPAIVPGAPEESLLIQAVNRTHSRVKMPPTGKLKPEEIADLTRWIKDGAVWPKTQPTAAAAPGKGFRPEQRAFWAFQPLAKAAAPAVRDKSWSKSAIDQFILAKLESQRLKPVGAAKKRVLIRRATFDLTGLPPTPEEIDAFLRDESSDAFARVVDRLLASKHYGERWGRYWLDVAAYGEDDARGGGSTPYPNAWRYRDWAIQAFNDDMPYDLFVKAQIAGDLLEKENETRLKPAVGYFALGPWGYEIAAPEVARANERDARIDALTRGFLGLTVACARCHDHKYDPITMQDYYALTGVFANSDYREYPLASAEEIKAYEKHGEKVRKQQQALDDFLDGVTKQLREIFAHQISNYMVAAWKAGAAPERLERLAAEEQLDAEMLKRWAAYLGRDTAREHPFLKEWDELVTKGAGEAEIGAAARKFHAASLEIYAKKKEIDEYNQSLFREAREKRAAAKPIGPNGYKGFNAGADLLAGKSLEIEEFLVWSELFGQKPPPGGVEDRPSGILTYEGKDLERFLQPEWKRHADMLRAELAALKKAQPKPYPFLMGLEDAETIANLKVNLRGNPYNLGEEAPRRFLEILCEGEPALFQKGSGRLELAEAIVAHPLAARVMANRVWQRLFGFGIVRSASNFGQVGDRPSHPELLDYLTARLKEHNWSLKSLIREVMLTSTYQLSSEGSPANLAKDPENRLLWRAHPRRLDAEAMRDAILAVSGKLDDKMGGPSAALDKDNFRRTLYGEISRHKLDEKLALFDFPNPGHSSEHRETTNVPLQRLFFLNSDIILSNAGFLADRLKQEAGADERERIRRAYLLLYGRPATPAELDTGLRYLSEAAKETGGSTTPSQRYAQVLLASNEFSYLD
jgi:mono/diheme cytochrome c family protein